MSGPVPATGLREEMVMAASRFLRNPKVAGSSEEQKLAFLRQKGLTEEEINEAVLRSPAVAYSLHSTRTCTFMGMRQDSRFLGVLQAVCNVIVVFFGGGYIIYYIVKTYVLPWLTGVSRRRCTADRLAELQASLDSSVRQLAESLRSLQTQVAEQQRAVSQLRPAADPASLQREITQLRAEVTSLKGLMLNRHQFVAAPSPPPAPSIPSWQMVKPAPAAAGDKSKADSSSSGDIVIVSGNNSDNSEDQHSDS